MLNMHKCQIMVKIDLKDRKILSALDMDARMPMTELARKVGLSRQVVEYRFHRMKKDKIIFGSRAIFDSTIAGFHWYRVALRLFHINKEEKNRFIETLMRHPNMSWLGEVGGNWDLVMNFICKNNFEFHRLFEELIAQWGKYILEYEILIYVEVIDLERDYILGKHASQRKEFYHLMKEGRLQLDTLDRDIIRELTTHTDSTNVELGNSLGVTPNTIKNRINGMKKSGLLLGFRLFINPCTLGYQSHMLFLGINRLNLIEERRLVSYLKLIPNVTFIVKHIGKWRIGLEIETASEQEFQEIFVAIRGKFSAIITNFESFPLFRDHVINYFPKGLSSIT